VVTALIYPMLILGGAVILSAILTFFVLPRLLPVFRGLGTDLPVLTRALIWMTEYITQHGIIIVLSIFVFVVGLLWFLKIPYVRRITHPLVLRMPIIGPVIRSMNLATTLRTLGILLKSSVPIDQSIELTNFENEQKLLNLKIRYHQKILNYYNLVV